MRCLWSKEACKGQVVNMLVKVHKVNDGSGRRIVAVCDDDLSGKRFESKELVLDLSASFYKGEPKSEQETAEILKSAYIANFVGKKSVDLGLRLGLISPCAVLKVKSVPHAQALL